MAWYSSPPLLYCIYLPAALVATALPYALTQKPSSPAPSPQRPLQAALLGYALVISAVAGLSVALGMGSGYLLAAWGVCALLAAGFVTLVRLCNNVSPLLNPLTRPRHCVCRFCHSVACDLCQSLAELISLAGRHKHAILVPLALEHLQPGAFALCELLSFQVPTARSCWNCRASAKPRLLHVQFLSMLALLQ